LELEREFYLTDRNATIPSQVHSLIAEAWIEPQYHPTADPASTLKDLPAREFSVKGRTFTCSGRSIDAGGDYPDWGSDLVATVYGCPDLPGGAAELKLESHLQGELFRFAGRVTDFRIVP
jgi:hypothetical protein